MTTTEPDLEALLDAASISIDAAVAVGGSLLHRRYEALQRAVQRGARVRVLLANPGDGWFEELLRPTRTNWAKYSRGIYRNASRVLMLSDAAQAAWQPFPVPWWFVVIDGRAVHLKAINVAGRPPATQIFAPPQVAYFQNLFDLAWSKAPPVGTAAKTEVPARPALRVFLCHASDDKSTVRELYHRLRADGVSPWLDEEELLPGQDWELEISRALQQSDVVLVCMSTRSIDKRGYVQRELRSSLRLAEEMPRGQVFLIPARLEPCTVPNDLAHLHWVDLFDPRGYDRLLRALRLSER